MKSSLSILLATVLLFPACGNSHLPDYNYERSEITLKAIYDNYGVKGVNLFRETWPFNDQHEVTYLAQQTESRNEYSYLWPFSGSLSALTALYEAGENETFLKQLEDRILPGLEMYFDTKRSPGAYASYINSAPASDRFYDDNIWLGIDFVDLYMLTKDKKYLAKAELIWKFIESGTDELLGGGVYWCEQKKESKNTCSNAPASVFALKLYEATKEPGYKEKGKALYDWTKNNLQDPEDYLYYDNIKLNGEIGRAKYAYNSGQMLQASALLYRITKDTQYLNEARRIAKSGYNQFFNGFQTEGRESFKLLKKGDVWFTAVMLRGFVELYTLDGNDEYINAFRKNLDYAWKYMREENGLFNSDWSGQTKDESKWLLTQFAMVEMYARLSVIK
ncbi:MAG: glycoside hydrolase family 76 protein [Paludibacter sp.]|nr:glycoside hydrolase family 76 protein [Paludibacter sp.]